MMSEYHLYQAELIDWLRGRQWLFENGFLPRYHGIISDPPYFLGSIVKRFGKDGSAPAKLGTDGAFKRQSTGFMNQKWDGFDSLESYQEWATEWGRLALSAVYPGAIGLFFGGTRTFHRLACGLENAGWEVVDCISYIYASGFPKALDLSKAIDKAAGAEREIIGMRFDGLSEGVYQARSQFESGYRPNLYDNGKENKRAVDITAPASPDAIRFDGYKTALKPAWEALIYARKPLKVVPFSDTIEGTNQLIGAAICLLLSSVNDVENLLRLSPQGQVENQSLDFAALLVGLKHLEQLGASFEQTVTFNSPETVLMCLSIARLWSAILDALLISENKYTTSTETGLIIGLKTLQSLIYPIMPEGITQVLIPLVGSLSGVMNVENPSQNGEQKSEKQSLTFAAVIAGLSTSEIGTPANTAASSLRQIIPNVVFALNDVIQTAGAKQPLSLSGEWYGIIVARAPRGRHTFADLALTYGTGAFAIDASRIPSNGDVMRRANNVTIGGNGIYQGGTAYETGDLNGKRYPANVLFSHAESCTPARCADGCPVKLLAEMSGETPTNGRNGESGSGDKAGMFGMGSTRQETYFDSGTAARFFFCGKAPAWERLAGLETRSPHPTMKNIELTEYLARLILPPTLDTPRRLLVPCAGVGSEMIGALLAGWDVVDGIEREAQYTPIAEARLKWWSQFKTYDKAKERWDSEHRGAVEDQKLEVVGQLPLFRGELATLPAGKPKAS